MLPNKGMIYPKKLDIPVPHNVACNVPQWRRYAENILRSKVECIDFYSLFVAEKKKADLFSLNHHVSSAGANLISHTIAEYLEMTTDIGQYKNSGMFMMREMDGSWYEQPEKLYVSFQKENTKLTGNDQIYFPYVGKGNGNNAVAIFGDCNLQAYDIFGAGIAENLVGVLSQEIDNLGRHLPFDSVDGLNSDFLKKAVKKEIVIYTAFASASYVRTSYFSLHKFGRIGKWSTYNI